MKRVFNCLCWTLSAALLSAIAFGVVTTFLLHWHYGVVGSTSMGPAIRAGDIVATRPVNVDDIDVNDLILYRNGEISTIHRVVQKKDAVGEHQYFITKGDANEDIDLEPVWPQNIEGKLVFRIPSVGYVTNFVSKPYAVAVALGIPLSLLILMYWWDARKGRPVPGSVCRSKQSKAVSLPRSNNGDAALDA